MEKWVKCNSKFILLISSLTIIPIEGYTINTVDDINVQATENLQQLALVSQEKINSLFFLYKPRSKLSKCQLTSSKSEGQR